MDSLSQSARRLKACTNCTNAKTKCTPYGNLNNLCERCHRLGKPCTYAEAIVRPKKNRQSSRKQLEEKVDSLVSLLSTIQNQPQSGRASSISNSRSPGDASLPSYSSSPNADAVSGASNDSPHATHITEHGPEVLVNLSPDAQNQLFSLYCRSYVQNFPFVTFPPSETVSTMSINRPLTLKSLLSVALGTSDLNVQRKAAKEVVAIIKQNMMSPATYSFDLLQAILIQAAYYHYLFRTGKQELFLLISYALTLLNELGIDKNPSEKRSGMAIKEMMTTPMEGGKHEQWRALLGVYYQTSIYAQAFRKPRILQYTKYMDTCRRRLVDAIEMQTDHTLDVMISMHLVCLDVNETFSLHDFENAEVSGDLVINSLVVGFLERLRAIEERTRSYRGGPLLPSEERLLTYSRLYTHEVAIHRDLWLLPSAHSPPLSAVRTKFAWQGLELAKSLLTHFADLSASEWLRVDSGPCTQMLYSLIMLNKCTGLDIPAIPHPTPGVLNKAVVDTLTAAASSAANSASTPSNTHQPYGNSQWDVKLAYKEANMHVLGTKLISTLVNISHLEKLYDEGRQIFWSLGWIAKNLVYGHHQRICGALSSLSKDRPLLTPTDASQESSPGAAPMSPRESQIQAGAATLISMASHPTPNLMIPHQQHTQVQNQPMEGSAMSEAFAMAFPDITFDTAVSWQDGSNAFGNSVWDTMMNDMTTMPF